MNNQTGSYRFRKGVKVYVEKVKSFADIPENLKTKTGWKKVGFKVREGEQPRKYFSYWNGMHYHNLTVYDLGQCDPIRGQRARDRRENAALDMLV